MRAAIALTTTTYPRAMAEGKKKTPPKRSQKIYMYASIIKMKESPKNFCPSLTRAGALRPQNFSNISFTKYQQFANFANFSQNQSFFASILMKICRNFKRFSRICQNISNSNGILLKSMKKTGIFAEHPFIRNKKIPIFFANFVLMDYGTGAIFGCPAHDQRDFDFAKKYELEIIEVVSDGTKKN